MIIVIPLEIKVREFLPKLYLTYEIVKNTDAKVLFAGQRFISNRIKKFKNVIYLDKNTHHSRLLKDPYNLINNIVCVLDEEGPISFFDQDTMHIRYNEKIKKIVNDIFLWGKKDLRSFKKKIFSNNNTFIYGHPKFDLLDKKNIDIFDYQVKKIKKTYKDFIFFPSSFESDPDKNLNIIKSQFKTYFQDFSNKKINKKIEQNFKDRRISQKNYSQAAKLLIKIAKENPSINIVFRKHPYENKQEIISRFKGKPRNLHIVFKYNVTPWIIASSIYIHSGCTTSLEAAILKKNIFMYRPYLDKSIREKELSKISKFFTDEKKLILEIKKTIKSKRSFKIRNIKNIIYNNNSKHLFCKSFVKYISKYKYLNSQIIFHNELGIFKEIIIKFKNFIYKFLSIIKNIILNTTFAQYLPEKHSFSKEATLNKLQNLTKKEILEYFLLFNKNKKKINIKVKKLDNGVFLINKLTKIN